MGAHGGALEVSSTASFRQDTFGMCEIYANIRWLTGWLVHDYPLWVLVALSESPEATEAPTTLLTDVFVVD